MATTKTRAPISQLKLIWFIVFVLVLMGVEVWAFNPNGSTGRGGRWQKEWTSHFVECFSKYGTHLASARPTDKSRYCTRDVAPVDYWLSIFIPLAKEESSFYPNASGRNAGRVPLGLYQMDARDMREHQCDGHNPRDPRQAICCAIKIADHAVGKASSGNAISAGRHGILATFFQPIQRGIGSDGRGGYTDSSIKHQRIIRAARRLCLQQPSNDKQRADDEGAKGPASAYAESCPIEGFQNGGQS